MSHVDDGWLHAYVDGELTAFEHDVPDIEAHIAQCPECRRRLQDARTTQSRVSAILGEASPPVTIIPPFDGVIGRATLAPRGEIPDFLEDPYMSDAPTVLAGPRFNHLIASGGKKKRAWNSRTTVVSVFFHSALIAGAVYATVKAPDEVRTEEIVEFMEIKEEEKIEEEKPEPEAPKPEEPPPVQGTQTLTPPEEPPAAIPEVDLSAPAVSAEDFSGVGQLGGIADAPPAEAPPPPPADFAYSLAELDRNPELRNGAQMVGIMERLYPRILQDAGIGGSVMMEFVIEPDGTVDMSTVKVLDSPHDQLSDASIKAVERFRFQPGRYKNEPVRVLIQMPITWRPAD